MKNAFFHSNLLCTSHSAVVDESEQHVILQQRSFDSQNNATTSNDSGISTPRKYVSTTEVIVVQPAVEAALIKKVKMRKKSSTAIDLDDEVSSDSSGDIPIAIADVEEEEKEHTVEVSDMVEDVVEDKDDVVSVESNGFVWSDIMKNLEEEPVLVIQEDERTQGSDNSKCSFGFEKPVSKVKKSPRAQSKTPIVNEDMVTDQVYVLDKTPAKLVVKTIVPDYEHDNTTCTWSESADSSIPTVIYIRRDRPPVVPDDEALGQHHYYSKQPVVDEVSKSYLMKGLRLLTLGAIGSNKVTASSLQTKMKKTHLDDDASEAFQQTLVDI
jgi:hypothetical protein